MSPHRAKSIATDHDRALADWIEAGTIVAALRRSAAAAAARASERQRASEALGRAGRRDAFAMGVADAAQLLSERAVAEARRLEAALREELRLRARVAAARAALDPQRSASEEVAVWRVRCG
jgi:hypothetical protein